MLQIHHLCDVTPPSSSSGLTGGRSRLICARPPAGQRVRSAARHPLRRWPYIPARPPPRPPPPFPSLPGWWVYTAHAGRACRAGVGAAGWGRRAAGGTGAARVATASRARGAGGAGGWVQRRAARKAADLSGEAVGPRSLAAGEVHCHALAIRMAASTRPRHLALPATHDLVLTLTVRKGLARPHPEHLLAQRVAARQRLSVGVPRGVTRCGLCGV